MTRFFFGGGGGAGGGGGGGGIVPPLPVDAAGNRSYSVPGYTSFSSGTTTYQGIVDRVYYEPFTVEADITIDTMAMAVTTGAGGWQTRMALYALGNDLQPGALIVDAGEFAEAGAGIYPKTVAAALTPGHYAFAWVTRNANIVYRAKTSVGFMVTGATWELTVNNLHGPRNWAVTNGTLGPFPAQGVKWDTVITGDLYFRRLVLGRW